MTEPEVDKKTGKAHDIHGSPMPGDEGGAQIGDQGGKYDIKDEKDADIKNITDHADLQTNDEAPDAIGDTKEVRTKGIGFDDGSDARTKGLVSTNL